MQATPMRRAALFTALLLVPAAAQAGTESIGTQAAIAVPAVAAGIAAYKGDWKGVVYLGLDTVATVGAAFALKQVIKERRPDGSDFKSFPSDTTALAASGSSFLWGALWLGIWPARDAGHRLRRLQPRG
jgi:membrane-associated phospholipid phosphatase